MRTLKIGIGVFGFQSKRADIRKRLQENQFLDPTSDEYLGSSQPSAPKKRRSDGHVEMYELTVCLCLLSCI
jgi:hypothetical protein